MKKLIKNKKNQKQTKDISLLLIGKKKKNLNQLS
jgi:hypothetical protein